MRVTASPLADGGHIIAEGEIYTSNVSGYGCCMAEPLDQRIQLVISKGQVREIDEWRRLQPDLPSRSEAIRRLIEAGLKSLANNRSGSSEAPASASCRAAC
jgi:hypothetical protein